MKIEFQFTLDDYRNAFRAHYRKGASVSTRWTLRLCLAIGAFLLLTSILLIATGHWAMNVALGPFLLGAAWIWIGMGGNYQWAARKLFTKNPALRQPRLIEVNDDGIKTDAGVVSSQHTWKAYLRYVETKDCFLLYTSPASFNIITKRVLQPSQVDELRQLFKIHIGNEAAVAVS